jgi:hypothetical protein
MLKKPTSDPTIHSNYRPISNLTFIGKVIERLVLKRLTEHLKLNDIEELYQSAYRSKHSTETALMKVHNDIATHLDANNAVLLVLLDQSAAFDTIDHQRLISMLRSYFGVSGTALSWFTSYLTNRTQRVAISGSSSSAQVIHFRVPQRFRSRTGAILDVHPAAATNF